MTREVAKVEGFLAQVMDTYNIHKCTNVKSAAVGNARIAFMHAAGAALPRLLLADKGGDVVARYAEKLATAEQRLRDQLKQAGAEFAGDLVLKAFMKDPAAVAPGGRGAKRPLDKVAAGPVPDELPPVETLEDGGSAKEGWAAVARARQLSVGAFVGVHGAGEGCEDGHGRIVKLEGAVARVQETDADGKDVGHVIECPVADLFLAARKTAKAPESRRDRVIR